MSELINEETFLEIMGDAAKTSSRYVSCIRINKSPILPPLIDDRYRDELIHYKNLAISVEAKIRERKTRKDNCANVDNQLTDSITDNKSSEITSENEQNFHKLHPVDCGKNKSNCAIHCLLRSSSPDNACLNPLMCDYDMWRYFTHCDEQISSAWFDNQNDEFLANFDAEIDKIPASSNLLPEKVMLSNSQLVPDRDSQVKEESCIPDKMGKSLDKVSDAVTKLRIFYAEYHKDIHKQNYVARNLDSNLRYDEKDCKIYESFDCAKMNQQSKSNCSDLTSQCDSETKFLEECGNSETPRINVDDSVMCISDCTPKEMETSAYEQYFTNLREISDRFIDIGCSDQSTDFQNHFSKENSFPLICSLNNAEKEPTSSSVESSLCDSSSVRQEISAVEHENNRGDVLGTPLKVNHGNKLSSIKISCSSFSLPEYPATCSVEVLSKLKPEKPYNPIYYSGCSGVDVENNNEEIFNVNDSGNKEQKEWSSNDTTNILIDDSGEDRCNQSVNELSTFLENTLNQRLTVDIPLSESASISEIDFRSSSVATVAPDTCDEVSEIPKNLSVEKDSELTPPKLVRQNSYTLITPSPILLAHAKANEKHEEKTSSEDDNSKNQVKNIHKNQDQNEGMDCNSKKGVKYVYAVPCKQTQICGQDVIPKERKAKERKEYSREISFSREKISSLPGSTVSSPVKLSLLHSSLDNLPIMTVRRFQELIDNKCIQQSKTINKNEQLVPSVNKMLGNRSSSLDLQKLNENCVGLKYRSKSDLQELKLKQTLESSPLDEEVSKKDVEILYRETSFDPSPSDLSHQLEINSELTPRSNQGIQTSFDETPHGGHCCSNQDNIEKREMRSVCKPVSPNDSTVQHIFLQLQKHHSELMSQLLDRQKKEQEVLANTFLNQQRQILQEMRLIPSLTADEQTPGSPTTTAVATCCLEKSSASQETQTFDSENEGSHISSTQEILPPNRNSNQNKFNYSSDSFNSVHHSQELDMSTSLPGLRDVKQIVSKEQVIAATVINAAARGYLIRRLLKTEHVQEIINTISESVQCALQLQRECPIDITPSDVELHRRLIQQLTAACYSLHDTFFSLSTQEKMNIIANDRDRRRNPASRPASARNSISSATQKYIQRKQQQIRPSERPVPSGRRSWWRNKARACSAGPYDQTSSCNSKQPIVVTSKQQCNNRAIRRPWR